jgi:hypothetical protein
MVDDDLFYKPIYEKSKSEIFSILNCNDFVCFSLRLGLNCIYSHPANCYFNLKNYKEINNELIEWNWNEQEKGDFNYPLSLDGHIFRWNLLKNYLIKINAPNPNVLESKMQNFLHYMPPKMISFKHSVLFGIPINRISNSSSNYFGKNFFYSSDELCQRYLNDEIIDIENLDTNNITSAHQEIALKFKHI